MSHQTIALIDHLDKSLEAASGKASPEPEQADEQSAGMEHLIATNEEVAREWQYLQMAVEAIQDAGLYEQVSAVRMQWQATVPRVVPGQTLPLAQEADGKEESTVVRPLYRNIMRVAACLVLLAGGASIFKYVRLSSSSLYSEYYVSYELNTSRGTATQDVLEQAYAAKNWTAVLSQFSTGKDRNNKADFLAGIADLELKKFDDAIAHFEQVIATNAQSHGDYFQDEAEYYLAISWLAKKKVNEAMPMLEKIRANKDHLYHGKVTSMSFLNLRLVQYKENK